MTACRVVLWTFTAKWCSVGCCLARALFTLVTLARWRPHPLCVRVHRCAGGRGQPIHQACVHREALQVALGGLRCGNMVGRPTQSAWLCWQCVCVCVHCNGGSGYDLENWGGFNRFSFAANISSHDLVQYFWPPFVSATQRGRVHSIMCVCERHVVLSERGDGCALMACCWKCLFCSCSCA